MPRQINKINYKGQQVDVGLDVHARSWQVTILFDNIIMKSYNQEPNVPQLASYLYKHYPGADYRVAYEAGFCGFSLQRALEAHGLKTLVLHAADLPTTHKEKIQKEDKRDSRKIAKSLHTNNFNAVYIPSIEHEHDRTLVRTRAQHVNNQRRLKSQIKARLKTEGIDFPEEMLEPNKHWSGKFMRWLYSLSRTHGNTYWQIGFKSLLNSLEEGREELLEITRALRQLAKEDRYSASMEIAISFPGISLITGMTLLTELGKISRFPNRDQFVSYLGLIPMTFSSGEKERSGSITHRRPKQLRSLLVESAWVAIRQDPALALRYSELKKKYGGQKAIIRIAKKLAYRFRSLMLRGELYQKGIA